MSKKNKNKEVDTVSETGTTNKPAEASAPAPVVEYKPTEEQRAQLAEAIRNNDWKVVTAISKVIAADKAKVEKTGKEVGKKEEEEKKAALVQVTLEVKDRLVGLIKELRTSVVGMDKADCVVFKWNFSDPDNLVECKLFKGSAHPASTGKSTGGGVGKKYAVKTEELLAKYGEDLFDETTGESFKAAWDRKTDGNWRYGIRVKLLKKEGMIKTTEDSPA